MSEGNPISGMTKEEEEEYREAFGMFDINGDGASRAVFLCCHVEPGRLST